MYLGLRLAGQSRRRESSEDGTSRIPTAVDVFRTQPGAATTVKAARGDYPPARRLARRQPGPPVNPAAAVRGPKHVVTKGATPVLTPAETGSLLDRIDPGPLVGLRDRALLSVLVYSFARVSATVGMRRQDYFRQGLRGWLRLHEKGGRRHDVPAPPGRAGCRGVRQRRRHRGPDGAAVSERRPGRAADGAAAGAPRRAGHDQAPGGGRGAAGRRPAATHVGRQESRRICRTGGRSNTCSGSPGTPRRRRRSSTTGRRTQSPSTRLSAS